MVVACDDANKKALLSLRQTEILQKLQGATLDPKLEKYKPAEWYVGGISIIPHTITLLFCGHPSRARAARKRVVFHLPSTRDTGSAHVVYHIRFKPLSFPVTSRPALTLARPYPPFTPNTADTCSNLPPALRSPARQKISFR